MSSCFFFTRSSFQLISIYLIILINLIQGLVPPSSTFKLVNQGDFGDYIVEYDGNYRALDVFTTPFQLCFYNTTPNAYTLALRMGLVRSESLFRWVWEANRGNPVGENATLTFGTDGNLVLANSDGRIAWQTNTSNKGVVAFRLLPTGNMVLHDAKGAFIWQSFDYPTDTLLVAQSFRSAGPTKLVSRVSAAVNADGPYSLVMEPRRVAMYYKTPFSPTPLLYYTMLDRETTLKQVTLDCSPDTDQAFAYDITFTIQNGDGSSGGTAEIARPKYNSTLSLLRLGMDGNLKVYTYSDKVDWAAWEATFTLFSRDSIYGLKETECQLPERCGKFGLCEDDQCVACPTPKGLLGWSKNCQQPKGSCGSNNYYKLDGVDHFLTKFTKGDGPMTIDDCRNKCSKDCKCLGYFYHQHNSRCWIAYDLKTLTKVSNGKHVGYIKS